LWGMVVMGVVGIAVFLLAMKYGDRLEEIIMNKLRK